MSGHSRTSRKIRELESIPPFCLQVICLLQNHKSPSNHHHIVDAESLKKSLEPRKSEIISIDKNLVDIIWSQERPERPKNKIFPLETKYSGESSQEKIRRLREELTEKGVKAMVVTMLDEVAWLFNLRGTDIDFNPGTSLIHVETPELKVAISLLCLRNSDAYKCQPFC